MLKSSRGVICNTLSRFVSQLRRHGDVLSEGAAAGGQPEPHAPQADGGAGLHHGSPHRLSPNCGQRRRPAVSQTAGYAPDIRTGLLFFFSSICENRPCCLALQILVQPQPVAILSGHNLRLSCYAVGKSPVQYQWFKAKEEVSSSRPLHERKITFWGIIYSIFFPSSGAKQHLPRHDDQSGLSQRHWVLHLQSQLWRGF